MTAQESAEFLLTETACTSTQAAGEITQPKTATRLFLLLVAMLLVIQAALNILLNPSGYFRENGMLISAVKSSDAFQKQKLLDQFLNAHAGEEVTIALGSSRIMMLSFDESSSAQPFFNAGISGGRAEDTLAFVRYLVNQDNTRIKRVVINVDPGVLGSAGADDYGLRLEGVYQLTSLMNDRRSWRQDLQETVSGLLSTDWLTGLAEEFVGTDNPKPLFDATNGVRSESAFDRRLKLADGDRHQLLYDHIDRAIANTENTRQDSRRVADFREAVRTLMDNGVEVTLVIMPYHSLLLDRSLGIPDFAVQMQETRSLLSELAQMDAVTVLDISDPRPLGIANDEFWWDGLHFTSQAMKIVANDIEQAGSVPNVSHAQSTEEKSVRLEDGRI